MKRERLLNDEYKRRSFEQDNPDWTLMTVATLRRSFSASERGDSETFVRNKTAPGKSGAAKRASDPRRGVVWMCCSPLMNRRLCLTASRTVVAGRISANL